MSTTTDEKYLNLPQERILAYSDSGNISSSTVVLFFHGAFGVGDATSSSQTLLQKNVHYVAPTLPGWGKSSPRHPGTPYFIQIASDTTALIEYLHPKDANLKLYIVGGSFGTVPAQMLYGAPFDIFPPGRYLKGCMVLAPFSPFNLHKEHPKSMTMQNYFAVGPPSQMVPFHLIQRLAATVLSSKLKTTEAAERFIRGMLFDKMDEAELEMFKKWREKNGKAEGDFERTMAGNMVRSVHSTWDGFIEISDVVHEDWGFRPATLDDEHVNRPIILVTSKGDTMAPEEMARWLAIQYKNAQLEVISGGHLAAIYHLDRLWEQLLEPEVV